MEYKRDGEACKDPNLKGISKEEANLTMVNSNISTVYELVHELEKLRSAILDRTMEPGEIETQFKISNFLFMALDELRKKKKKKK
jgi:hypothetical protein